jgi:hypothetical protein
MAATIATPKNGSWRPRFLEVLAGTGNVRLACHACGIDRCTAYRHREKSKQFAAGWEEAMENAIDLLEAAAWKRAQAASDTLLIFLMKSHRRELYGDHVTVNVVQKAAQEVAGMDRSDVLKTLGYTRNEPTGEGSLPGDPEALCAGEGEG